jgi:glutamate/tyrosine decarboxylase-like PLP-dependent enzyme
MCIDSLRTRLAEDRASGRLPFLVVATAGSVSTGVIDPVRALADLCQKEDLWLHADGAYGAPAAVLPDAPDDLHALSLADSVAMDPHKWLYCPIEAACVITKHERALQDAFGFYPDYYLFDEEREAGINYYEVAKAIANRFETTSSWPSCCMPLPMLTRNCRRTVSTSVLQHSVMCRRTSLMTARKRPSPISTG